MEEMLNALEHETIELLGEVWGDICNIVGRGPSREADLAEAIAHIHALQHFVMAQAASRAYPDRYRLLGRTL